MKHEVKVSKLALTFIVNHQANVVKHVDSTRYTLTKTHARVPPDGTAWVIESTDGHRAVTNMVGFSEITHDKGGVMQDMPLEFAYEFADDFKLLLKKHKNMGETFMIDVSPFAAFAVKGQFPDLQAIMPRAETLQWSISLNAEYLEEMLLAMRDTKRQTAVTLKFSGDKNPIVVTCGGSSYGVLMPVRGETQWGPSEEKASVAS